MVNIYYHKYLKYKKKYLELQKGGTSQPLSRPEINGVSTADQVNIYFNLFKGTIFDAGANNNNIKNPYKTEKRLVWEYGDYGDYVDKGNFIREYSGRAAKDPPNGFTEEEQEAIYLKLFRGTYVSFEDNSSIQVISPYYMSKILHNEDRETAFKNIKSCKNRFNDSSNFSTGEKYVNIPYNADGVAFWKELFDKLRIPDINPPILKDGYEILKYYPVTERNIKRYNSKRYNESFNKSHSFNFVSTDNKDEEDYHKRLQNTMRNSLQVVLDLAKTATNSGTTLNCEVMETLLRQLEKNLDFGETNSEYFQDSVYEFPLDVLECFKNYITQFSDSLGCRCKDTYDTLLANGFSLYEIDMNYTRLFSKPGGEGEYDSVDLKINYDSYQLSNPDIKKDCLLNFNKSLSVGYTERMFNEVWKDLFTTLVIVPIAQISTVDVDDNIKNTTYDALQKALELAKTVKFEMFNIPDKKPKTITKSPSFSSSLPSSLSSSLPSSLSSLFKSPSPSPLPPAPPPPVIESPLNPACDNLKNLKDSLISYRADYIKNIKSFIGTLYEFPIDVLFCFTTWVDNLVNTKCNTKIDEPKLSNLDATSSTTTTSLIK
jgi:hypothetical protein